MKAVLIERHLHRFAAARAASFIAGSTSGVRVGPAHLVEIEPIAAPGKNWRRIAVELSGICGSDLATLDGTSSRFFESIVSFPFVLGHEILGKALDGPLEGSRVVIEPVLGCLAREIDPPCSACAAGNKGACERIAFGHIKPGLQTGFCADTGGGWSEELVAHDSQIHRVPEGFSDDAAVLVEPTACAIHAAARGNVAPGEHTVILGTGTLGLLTIAALRAHFLPTTVIAVAKHAIQRDFSTALGADLVVEPDEVARAVRRVTGALAVTGSRGKIERLAGGADVVFDCVGSAQSLAQSLEIVRQGGRIVLVGMPSSMRVDLAALWQREVTLLGAYAYGTERVSGGTWSTFDLAFELVGAANLERLVSAYYPLSRYDEAVRHAGAAGRRGAVKVAFDLRRSVLRRSGPPPKPGHSAKPSTTKKGTPT
jgi:threonine dehydrogenase-like Zn-dependent dehydrogenase